MQIFNWGIIGPGSIAATFAQAMSGCEFGQIRAVASRNPQRAAEFAQRFDIPNRYVSYQALVNDPQIDIVYIATPHSFHYQQAKLCLEAGKHVLVEKPSTVNATQMQELVEIAKRNEVLLQEGLWSRFMPSLSQLKQLLTEGIIGDIQYIQSDIGFAFQNRDTPKSRMLKPELAGGALLDLGIYSISLSQFFLEEHPSSIHALGQLTEEQVDEHCLVNMCYPSGRYAQFTCSMLSQASNGMTIVGSEGYVRLPACFWDGVQPLIYKNNTLVKSIDIPHPINGFEYEIEETMRCVAAGKPCSDLMSHQDSISVLSLMDEVRRQIGVSYPAHVEAL